MLDSGKIETKDGKYYPSPSLHYGKIATKDGGREGVGRSIFSQLLDGGFTGTFDVTL